jgi:hypothetical protein
MLPLSVELATALDLDGQVINRTDIGDGRPAEPHGTRTLPASVSMLDGGPTPDGEPFGLDVDESDQETPGAPGAVPADHEEPAGVLGVGKTEQKEEQQRNGGAVSDSSPERIGDGPAVGAARSKKGTS